MNRRATSAKGAVLLAAAALVLAASLVAHGATTLEFIYLAGADATEERYRILTEAFEAANPDIKVERIRVISNYEDRLTTLIATGTVPDVISLDMNYIMAFGDERFLYDLLPLIERTPQFQFEHVARPMIDVFTVDGKLFAAPIWANPTAYVYSVGLFDQSGLASPYALYVDGAWTWEAFREAARKLTRQSGDGRIEVIGASMHLPRTWIFSNGGREFDSAHRPTRTFYGEPEAIEALEFIHAMMSQDGSMERAGSPMTRAIGADDVVGFAQGKIGMSTRWLASLPAFAEGGFEIGILPYPKGPAPGGRHVTDLGMFGLSISRATKDLDAAWRFVSFLSGPEGAAIEGDLPGSTPSRPVSMRWLSDLVINPEVYPDLLVGGTLRVISKDRTEIQRIIDTELNAVWNNTAPVESAVAEITRRIEAFLQENPQ